MTLDRRTLTYPRTITLVWSIDDVQMVREDLNDEQAFKVLLYVERNHDASRGVNWDVIEWAAAHLFGSNDVECPGGGA